MVAEVVCICDNVPDRREIFDLFIECYPEEIRKVDKVDFSFIMRGIRFKFTIPRDEIEYLKARHNVVLCRPWYFRQNLLDEIERRKQNERIRDQR